MPSILPNKSNNVVLGQIYFKNSLICDSLLGGMFLSNCVFIIDYKTIYIQKNSDYALHIPEQNMTKFVFFYLRNTVMTLKNCKVLEQFGKRTSYMNQMKQSGITPHPTQQPLSGGKSGDNQN